MSNSKFEKFKVGNDNHTIDVTGNHFINGRCVNPRDLPTSIKAVYNTDGVEVKTDEIGSTHPPMEVREYFKVVGHIDLVEVKGKMYAKSL